MEAITKRESWNKGKLVGQKPPLKPKDIWAIRIHLQNADAVRDLAMFNLAIDSKLRGCDLVSLRVRDITHGNQVLPRAMVIQRKTQRPVQFELTEPTRVAASAWLDKSQLRSDDFPLPEQVSEIAPCIDQAVREDRASLGRSSWAGFIGLWNSLDAANESDPDLQAHEEPASRSAAAWPHQAGEHRPIRRHRGGRRAGDLRANRDLAVALRPHG